MNPSDRAAQAYGGKRVVVTGAAGFIGVNLVQSLTSAGCNVNAWVRPGQFGIRMESLKRSQAVLREIDLADSPGVVRSLRETAPEIVFHLGAVGGDGREHPPHEYVRQNVLPCMTLLEESVRMGFRLVAAGTMFELPSSPEPQGEAVEPKPITRYAWSKVAALHYFQLPFHREINWMWLRLFGVYGPWESPSRLFPYVLDGLMRGRNLELSSCRIIRDFVYIDDVLEALGRAGLAPHRGEVVNVGAGKGHLLRRVLECFADESKADRALLQFGRRPDRSHEIDSLIASPDKADQLLGWKARIGIAEGLHAYRQWRMSEEARCFGIQ